jgi:hypothetical protein
MLRDAPSVAKAQNFCQLMLRDAPCVAKAQILRQKVETEKCPKNSLSKIAIFAALFICCDIRAGHKHQITSVGCAIRL